MSDLNYEKHRAEVMARMGEYPDQQYWEGYRIGLTSRSQHHDAILAAIGSEDLGRDAYGRGYRDGVTFRTGVA